mmetsp:Transcript_45550/g.74222  ORF Transcript_45550/g.74222 Transcript_45550/m.74222 type:complete len:201 (+) Transcript_45550:187-789(+)
MTFIKVDLPAPLWPIMAVIVPAAKSPLIPFRTVFRCSPVPTATLRFSNLIFIDLWFAGAISTVRAPSGTSAVVVAFKEESFSLLPPFEQNVIAYAAKKIITIGTAMTTHRYQNGVTLPALHTLREGHGWSRKVPMLQYCFSGQSIRVAGVVHRFPFSHQSAALRLDRTVSPPGQSMPFEQTIFSCVQNSEAMQSFPGGQK